MSHDELNGMAAYALSALEADELDRFEEHLATCPECQSSVAAIRPAVDALSMTGEEAAPAHGLRGRILASAREERGGSETAAHPGPENGPLVAKIGPAAASGGSGDYNFDGGHCGSVGLGITDQ